MPTSSRQNMLFYENLRRIRNFYWVDVGIDPYKCGLLEVRPFLLRSLYRLRKRNEPSKKGQRLEAQARSAIRVPSVSFLHTFFWLVRKKYAAGGTLFAAQRKGPECRPYGCIPLIKAKPEGIRLRASFLIAAAAHTSRRRYPRSGRPLRPSARRNRKTLLPSRFRCCCARSEAPPL